MTPEEIGQKYDQIAAWWLEQMRGSTSGIAALERALKYVKNQGSALDVGCGCEGRFIRILLARNFDCTGLDISRQMLSLLASQLPQMHLIAADICTWEATRKFDLITAWDSIFHLPLESHGPVISKLCGALNPGGVLLFTAGGGETPGEIEGEFGGQRFSYSTLGVPGFVECIMKNACSLKHIEYDQYPENHVYFIASKS